MSGTLKELVNIKDFIGLEFGTFKIKEGALESEMLAAAKTMEDKFLSKEPGFLGHSVLKNDDGTYVDIAFSKSQKEAEIMCEKWLDNEFACKYLEFIDPESVSMGFWSRIK